MYNNTYVQQYVCTTIRMYNNTYVQQYVCTTIRMYNNTYVQPALLNQITFIMVLIHGMIKK